MSEEKSQNQIPAWTFSLKSLFIVVTCIAIIMCLYMTFGLDPRIIPIVEIVVIGILVLVGFIIDEKTPQWQFMGAAFILFFLPPPWEMSEFGTILWVSLYTSGLWLCYRSIQLGNWFTQVSASFFAFLYLVIFAMLLERGISMSDQIIRYWWH